MQSFGNVHEVKEKKVNNAFDCSMHEETLSNVVTKTTWVFACASGKMVTLEGKHDVLFAFVFG